MNPAAVLHGLPVGVAVILASVVDEIVGSVVGAIAVFVLGILVAYATVLFFDWRLRSSGHRRWVRRGSPERRRDRGN